MSWTKNRSRGGGLIGDFRAVGKPSQNADGTWSVKVTITASPDSFDGRLLAEYDIYGTCLKDYIYMGSRLVAE